MGRSERLGFRRRSRRALVLVLAGGLASSAVACAGILGLDEFDKGECAGARCGDGAPPPDVVVTDGPFVPDAGDGGLDGTTGTDPTTWAKWPMPNYNLPDGAPGPGLAPAYAKVSGKADEVVDTNTGLTWKRVPAQQPQDLLNARNVCAALDTAVKWRVPKRIELVTIIDYGQSSPPYVRVGDPGFDNAFPSGIVWTSSSVLEVGSPTTSVRPTSEVWAVNFSTGKLVKVKADAKHSVLCVKGL